jgi:predicted phosphodiesterase
MDWKRIIPSTALTLALGFVFVGSSTSDWSAPLRLAGPAEAAEQRAATAPLPQPAAVTLLRNEKDSVKFAVIGDTGTGRSPQYDIAKLLAAARERFPFEFVLMLGDNIYGSESPADFVRKFERPYKPLLDAGIKFYATLGNHDESTQRFYKPFNMEGKRFYTFRKSDVEFFVLDSTYITPAQVTWLKDALERSDAKWKIPYFHHPIYSSGAKHGSETDLRQLVEPLFVQYGVDVVFSGHEHFYERLKPQKGIYYFTQGGSAKLRKGNIRDRSSMTEKGFDTDNSFMLVEIVKDQMIFETISRKNQVVDSGAFMRREVVSTD